MFKTRVTELFGIEYPIISGGLAYLSRAELVAAVANAGCIGFITSGTFDSPEELRREIRRARELTDKPIGVNLNLFPGSRPEMLDQFSDVLIEEGIKAVEGSGRSPAAILPKLKQAGVKYMHKVARVKDAASVERLGVDAIAVAGYECGGHPALTEVSTVVLVPSVVDAVKIPVVAAGGFADGRGLVTALALGAEAVLMGTAFMATAECPAHPKLKEWLIQAAETDTAVIQKSIGNPSRVIRNQVAEQVLAMEAKGATLEELLPMISGRRGQDVWDKGEMDAGVAPCGQSVGLVKKTQTVKEFVDEVLEQAAEVMRRLNKELRPLLTE
ncbi:MAG: nitronate monooxygenase [Chloroflexi bacterium]|nr:nitronate monooxygenase [Chloroflexota bacterium]